jgi:pimeloyl-ACP methyl ester carboxylesterase
VRTLTVAGQEAEIVQTNGGGVPVLWLPGAQGTGEMFFRQFLAWGERRTLVAVSYPAVTDAVALADFVAAAADVLGIESFDLVGSSLGGWIGQWVAARHGERLGRLVVGNSFFDPAPAQSPEKRHALESRNADEVKVEAMARVAAQPDSELKAVQLELMGRCQSAESLRTRMLAVQRATPAPSLGIPEVRLLIVECDHDPLIPGPMRAALRAAHPHSPVCVIEGGGHYPYITKADAYNAVVGAFLELS